MDDRLALRFRLGIVAAWRIPKVKGDRRDNRRDDRAYCLYRFNPCLASETLILQLKLLDTKPNFSLT